ncbi:MAG: YIP1 family protein [Candidatus Brachytrichaceae bacterium NZ_4S206]|jgi:sugar lactone lactonase YvrE
MKRALRVWLIVLLGAVLGAALPARALTPYTTWTMGPGGRLFLTQDAYIPIAEVDLPVSAPEDMFLAPDGALYLADTGNGRILKLRNLEVVGELGKGALKSPTGVTVDEDGVVYVADAGNETVAIFEPDGRLRRAFGRPSEPLFGKRRQFLPRKLAVDARRNLYVVSEGSVDGLALMNTEGNFIGYFAANSAEMSLKMILQRLFLTREQLEQFVKTEAASPSNVAIDRRGLVYTVTAGTARDRSLRKFTINGRNLFHDVYGSTTFRDVQVSDAGLLLAVDANGQIYEYDLNGTLLFKFGASDRGEQRLGTLSNPTAIERAGDELYVLDKDKNAIVVYQVTDFARRVHDGVRLYMEGRYTEAQPYFEDVLRYNGLFIMAYQAIADAHYKRGDYAQALATYRYAEDRNGYSQAFWELRNAVLQRHLANAMIGVFGLWVAISAFGRLQRRHHWFDPLLQRIGALRRIRLVDDFVFLFRFIKQPADSFYYIKANLRGSLAFAFILYAWVVVVRIASLYLTSFIFSPYANPTEIRVEVEAAYVIVALALWNVANYLVSTISDGEGRLRDVVIGTAYSLFPYALFALPIALISNVLTLNEVFLYEFTTGLVWFWVGLLLFLMVKEIHNYTLSETVRNILITLFTMTMFLLTGYILYVLFDQVFEFISAIVQEVGLRG